MSVSPQPLGLKRCRASTSLSPSLDTDKDTNTDRKKKMRLIYSEAQPLCVGVYRLANLPEHIQGRILSLLPTKDVAAVLLSSKRMERAFSLLSSVDLDDAHTCDCRDDTHLVEQRFPLFKSFVGNVLDKLESEQPLTRFRLCFGENQANHKYYCTKACFPYLEPDCLNSWISCPLSHTTLTELDLSFHISNPKECKLPPQLFNCRSLVFFRLDCNIRIHGTDILTISLPNLKLMHILSVVFSEDNFVTRLVSSCPVLEDLSITNCEWKKFTRITISSHCLRKLVLYLSQQYEEERADLVTIDTPNLQYFNFSDDLPYRYTIAPMNSLVEAKLCILDRQGGDPKTSFQTQNSLLSSVADVQHLFLHEFTLEIMTFADDLENRLPVFCNLRTLTLPPGTSSQCWRWDISLLLILRSSPLLETLVFPEGILTYSSPINASSFDDREEAELEAEGWRANTLPLWCLTHLKRIEFGHCFGIERELNMIKFFLGKALALKELVLCLFKDFHHPRGCRFVEPNFEEFVSKLDELPRASNSCSIIVCQ